MATRAACAAKRSLQAARIFAVADVFDALLSARSYKRPWSVARAPLGPAADRAAFADQAPERLLDLSRDGARDLPRGPARPSPFTKPITIACRSPCLTGASALVPLATRAPAAFGDKSPDRILRRSVRLFGAGCERHLPSRSLTRVRRNDGATKAFAGSCDVLALAQKAGFAGRDHVP
jgi:hypothetical protein